MKQSKFIGPFLEMLKEMPQLLYDAFRQESFYRKDLRIGGFDPDKLRISLESLKHRNILKATGQHYRFTKNGRAWVGRSIFRYCKINNLAKWDDKWRVVVFDIPQELHGQRIKFRRKLKQLNFYPIQKSVFVFPYICEDELGYICGELKISKYVDVLVSESIGALEDEVKKYYKV